MNELCIETAIFILLSYIYIAGYYSINRIATVPSKK